MKIREAESKGGKERYIHLNAEFQRIVRTDKKAFLSNQCKETEENNRMGKTRDLVKKIRNTKGTFHAKMGSIKHKICMDLTESEDIKKSWQEYTELSKKVFHDPDNHDGVTNLDSSFKSRDITLLTRVHIVKAMVFPVVIYECENWTVQKAEC